MDPLLFAVNDEVVFEVLAMLILLSLILERGLSMLFEWRIFIEKASKRGMKEPIAFIAALIVIVSYKFDALAILFSEESTSYIGYIVTAGVIAGGSKGSIKLFRDWLGWKSNAQLEQETRDNVAGGNQ